MLEAAPGCRGHDPVIRTPSTEDTSTGATVVAPACQGERHTTPKTLLGTAVIHPSAVTTCCRLKTHISVPQGILLPAQHKTGSHIDQQLLGCVNWANKFVNHILFKDKAYYGICPRDATFTIISLVISTKNYIKKGLLEEKQCSFKK